MRARRRPKPTPREIGILLGASLAGAIVLGALIAANTRWSAILPGGCGFYSVWAGVREFLFRDGDPYGAAAAAQAQQLAYRGSPPPMLDPCRLDLPFFLVPLYFPFGLIADPDVARGVWATVAQMAIIGATILGARLVGWNPPRAVFFALSLTALFWYPGVAAIVDGTPVTVLLLVYLAILQAIQTEKDELAGALAVLALCKWEVGLPFLVIVAIRIIQERRWRIAAGFGMLLTILLVLAFLLLPGWFMPYLVGTVAELRFGQGMSMQSVLLQLMPEAGSKVALALAIVTLTLLVVELRGTRGHDFRRFTWIASLALAATPFLGMRSEFPNFVMLVPGIVMIAAAGWHRRSSGGWIALCLLGGIYLVPWILASSFLTAPSGEAMAMLFLFLPLACLIGMYWTRWWFLRPARTWLDEVRGSR